MIMMLDDIKDKMTLW